MRDDWTRLSQPPYYITAYEYAKRGGYAGTEKEFGTGLAASARAVTAAEAAERAAGYALSAAITAKNSAADAERDAEAARQSALTAAADAVESLTDLSMDVVTDYLDEHITNPSNPPIDTGMTVAGAAADAEMVGRMIDTDGYIFPTIEQGALTLVDGVITETSSVKRLRLASPLSDGIFEISCDEGYYYLLWVTGKTVGYGSTATRAKTTLSFDSNGSFSISMGRVDDGNISTVEGRHLHIRRVDDFGTPEQVRFNSVILLGDLNAPALAFSDDVESNAYYYKQSDVFRVPEGGFSVSLPFAVVANRKYWYAAFYKMVDGRLQLADDYSYGYMVEPSEENNYGSTRTVGTSMTIYYPYEEGVYAQIGTTGAADICVTTYDRREGGRPLTVAPMSVKPIYEDAAVVGYEPSFRTHYSGNYRTQQLMRGTVIRLADADGVCCSPRYRLCAWFYNASGEIVDEEYANPALTSATGGPTYIDFRGRDAVFALVGICCAIRSAGSGATERTSDCMGVLAREDDILDSVHVMWRQHVVINHRNELPWVIGENLRWLKTHTFPEILAHRYRGPWTPNEPTLLAEKDATLGFYGGRSFANAPLSLVTMESYSAALQHLYSRAYVGEWSPYDVDDGGNVVKPTGYTLRGYGWICSYLPPVLCGFKWFSEAPDFYKIQNYNGFEIIRDFNLRADVGKLRPGDWLWGQALKEKTVDNELRYRYDYHTMLVTDIISINGEPFCIECLESYPPSVRRRFICLDDTLATVTGGFGSEDELNYFNLVARPNPRDMRLIPDAFATEISEYTVGKLACDRGHESVYCLDDAHIYVTVYDDEVEDIVIVKDGDTENPTTINLAGRVIHFYGSTYRTIDLITDVRVQGKYDLYADAPVGDPEDSFYVPDVPVFSIDWSHAAGQGGYVEVDTGGVVGEDGRVVNPDGYEIVNVVGWYQPTVDGGLPAADYSDDVEYVYDPDAGEWKYVIRPGGGISPADAAIYSDLRFRMAVRAEDLTEGKFRFPYATKFPGGNPEEDKDFVFNWALVQYIAEHDGTVYGGFIVGRDRIQLEDETVIDRVWCNTDCTIPPIPTQET